MNERFLVLKAKKRKSGSFGRIDKTELSIHL